MGSRFALFASFIFLASTLSFHAETNSALKGSFRKPVQNGWIYVHLEGSPYEIGFQHGYMLANEIQDAEKVVVLEQSHHTKKDWQFFRDAARDEMWPHIEQEYREELRGIAEGLKAKGVGLDVWDVVALNAFCEWEYFIKEYNRAHRTPSAPALSAPDHCSAFVATGSYTKDGRVIIAHNDWTNYLDGSRWIIVFDIAPSSGNHILMDGFPGAIHSADDFGINSAGIMITETTISHYSGYDLDGIPEFIRARKAMQYSNSIDDFARIMKQGNNGGYANTWLVADRKTNEIASLELGLKNVNFQRKKDGYFVGSNFPADPKLIREETNFNTHDRQNSANARHRRWEQLMAEYKGKIDVAAAKKFLSDHYDSYENKEDPDERTLCGHIELSPRGEGSWQPPFGTAGAVQNKIADATMAEHMTFIGAAGHACGLDFKSATHLERHPEFSWEKSLLRDMNAYPWTTFTGAADGAR